jgi:SAM-dependent MidA family methyltransferase
MRFDEFMRLALYHPHYGYYSRGDRIFGSEGDFITAPGLSPLFGQTLGRALTEIISMEKSNNAYPCEPVIYEFGAGDGRLACDILTAIGSQVEKYNIIDLSGGLKAKQAARIERELSPDMARKVHWLHQLPECFEGIVIGNELLDAMPVRRFVWTSDGVLETFVTVNGSAIPNNPSDYPLLTCVDLPAGEDIRQVAEQLREKHGPWPSPYRTEWGVEARAWIETVTQKLRGFALMIDYGRDSEQYYNHSQNQGFLRAHSQHVAHDGFLEGIGLQDLTCHVDFSGIYDSIVHAGGELEGYCTQSAFLRYHGILELAASDEQFLDPLEGGAHRQAINMLLSEAEMGENFKVMCWSKGAQLPEGKLRSGFIQHDLSHLL